ASGDTGRRRLFLQPENSRVHRGVEGMHRERDAAELERDVHFMRAGHEPDLADVRVVHELGALEAAVYPAGDRAAVETVRKQNMQLRNRRIPDARRDLGQREAGVDDDRRLLFVGSGLDHRLVRDGLPVGAQEPIRIEQNLEMLVRAVADGDIGDRELGLARDVRVARQDLSDGEVAREHLRRVVQAPEGERDVVGRRRVLNEDVVEDGDALVGGRKGLEDDRARAWAEPDQSLAGGVVGIRRDHD
ncbi:unnamed protein product, partial [Mycena citricolor]